MNLHLSSSVHCTRSRLSLGGWSQAQLYLSLTCLGYFALIRARFTRLCSASQAVVFSEGTLYLDECNFSGSTASVLVYSEGDSTTVVRNAVLGDNNCEQFASAGPPPILIFRIITEKSPNLRPVCVRPVGIEIHVNCSHPVEG